MTNRLNNYPFEFWEHIGLQFPAKPGDEELAEALQVIARFPELWSGIEELHESYNTIVRGFPEEEVRKMQKRYGNLMERMYLIGKKILEMMAEDVARKGPVT